MNQKRLALVATVLTCIVFLSSLIEKLSGNISSTSSKEWILLAVWFFAFVGSYKIYSKLSAN